jgi:DNA-binding transcriptional LysR family regulator
MTLHRLQLFASIAKRLNISQLSRELHVSQPAVSQQLKLLQEEFGTTLLKKNGRGLQLTEAGKAFLKDAEFITAQVEGLKTKYTGKQAVRCIESLRIGGTIGPSTSVLPALMTQFKQRNPGIEFSLKTGSSLEIEDSVLTSEVELAIIANPLMSPLLEMEPFRKEILSVFVAARHPLAKKKKISPEELAALPLIIRGGRNSRNLTDEFLCGLIARGLKPNVFMRLESLEAVKAAVKDGKGGGILYRDVVDTDVRLGMLKILDVTGVDLTCSSYIVYSRKTPLSRGAQDFLALLRAARKRRPC